MEHVWTASVTRVLVLSKGAYDQLSASFPQQVRAAWRPMSAYVRGPSARALLAACSFRLCPALTFLPKRHAHDHALTRATLACPCCLAPPPHSPCVMCAPTHPHPADAHDPGQPEGARGQRVHERDPGCGGRGAAGGGGGRRGVRVLWASVWPASASKPACWPFLGCQAPVRLGCVAMAEARDPAAHRQERHQPLKTLYFACRWRMRCGKRWPLESPSASCLGRGGQGRGPSLAGWGPRELRGHAPPQPA